MDINNGLVQLNSPNALFSGVSGTINMGGGGTELRLNGNSLTLAGLNGGGGGLLTNTSAL